MSSDWTSDPNEHLHRLLSQFQQYSSSSAQRQQTVGGVLPTTAAMAPTPPAGIQGLGSLLASYKQQSIEGITGANITTPAASTWNASRDAAQSIPGFQAQVQPQHQLDPLQPASFTNFTGAALSQQILASAQLLSAFNPGVAAAAIAQALSLNPQQSIQQQPQQQLPPPPQQQQQQNQPNQFKASLESLYQQLQKQISHPSASPVTVSIPSNSATAVPSSNVNNLGLSQMNVAQSDKTEQDTRSAIKHVTTLPISLHCLNQGKHSQAETALRSNACPPLNLSAAQNWTLEQLESHAKQLQDSHQPIPQSIAILLASARRKDEKQKAKKLANRKSAFSSRVRKKAKIDAMAEENERLKREATILSFLPDPVVAISIHGEITFCSRQMERVLQNKADDLMGENIENLIAPDSWGELQRMIKDVVTANEKATLEEWEDITSLANATKRDGLIEEENGVKNLDSGNPSSSSMQACEQSFPVLEVEVDSCENVSDPWGYFVKKKSSKESKQTVSANDSYPETSANKETDMYNNPLSKKSRRNRQQQSCLNRTCGLQASPSSSSLTEKQEYKSSMSANSSLSKTKDRPSASNPSEDSGYRESNDSQESNKSSSYSVNSTDDDDDDNFRTDVKRVSPLAPSCQVRLICNDLRTLWCELTASIHPGNTSNGDGDLADSSQNPNSLNDHQMSTHCSSSLKASSAELTRPNKKTNELLLCFRPFCEGPKVGEEIRYRNTVVAGTPKESERPSNLMNDSSRSSSGKRSIPPQKRKFISDEEEFQEGQT